jgi:amidase
VIRRYSVVSPAGKSGIVGYKPTRGVIGSEGIIHASQRLDTVGLLTRSVQDAVLILSEIIRHSNHHTPQTRLGITQDISLALPTSNLDSIGLRIGIPWSLSALQLLPSPKLQSFRLVLATFKSVGAMPVHGIHIAGAKELESSSSVERSIILDTDMKLVPDEYMSSLVTNPQNIHTIADFIAFTQSHSLEEHPARNTEAFERAALTSSTRPLYFHMLEKDS